jgi:hypothetical protein
MFRVLGRWAFAAACCPLSWLVVLLVGVAHGQAVTRAAAGQATPAASCSAWVAATDWGTCVNGQHTRAEVIVCDGVQAYRIRGGPCVTAPASNVGAVESVGAFSDTGDARIVIRVPKGVAVVVRKGDGVRVWKAEP